MAYQYQYRAKLSELSINKDFRFYTSGKNYWYKGYINGYYTYARGHKKYKTRKNLYVQVLKWVEPKARRKGTHFDDWEEHNDWELF